jgi:hypothetical protein
LRRGEGERLGDRRQPLAIARDEQDWPVRRCFGGRRRQREGFKTIGDAIDDELAGPALGQSDAIGQAHKIMFQFVAGSQLARIIAKTELS